MVCALAGARRGRGFEPRFVCPSRGPPVRSPPPPPSATRSTSGTAAGWVACLVLIVFSYCGMSQIVSGMSEGETKKQGTKHSTPAVARSATGTALRRRKRISSP